MLDATGRTQFIRFRGRAEGPPSDDERACGYRFPREFAGVHPYYFAKLNLNPVEISRSLR